MKAMSETRYGVGLSAPVGASPAPRLVIARPRPDKPSAHETASQQGLAGEIAGLFGWRLLSNDESCPDATGLPYYVPCDTLVASRGVARAAQLRINGHDDLFGGMVPYPFAATKAITHSLPELHTQHPPGWSTEFGVQVRNAVLRGVTAFCAQDARRGAAALLEHGPIRLKPVDATAGRGQLLLKDQAALEAALDRYDAAYLAEHGVVFEEHLEAVTTFSVGQAHIGHLVCTYVGTQTLTPDNTGALVYGGSHLFLVRGGFDELLEYALAPREVEAIRLACIYDEAALRCFPGLYASRRNYDVAHGQDMAGRLKSGVLEQSWRPGGASMAEIHALKAFHRDPLLNAVRAYTLERYGESVEPPPGAQIVYRGHDEKVGFITKCAGIQRHDDH